MPQAAFQERPLAVEAPVVEAEAAAGGAEVATLVE